MCPTHDPNQGPRTRWHRPAWRFSIPPLVWIVLLASGSALPAAVITVDGLDSTVADDGICTLREAIAAANTDTATGGCPAGSGADTIEITGSVNLTVEDSFDSGLPKVTSTITVRGQNGDRHSILRDLAGPEFRIFWVMPAGDLTIENTAVQRGGGATFNGDGAGIFNQGALTLQRAGILNNTTTFPGGGILSSPGSTLDVIDSDIGFNEAVNGGGIFNQGTATIARSHIALNTVTSFGGGIYNRGEVSITESTVRNNTARLGAGIYNSDYPDVAVLTLTNSTVSANTASGPDAMETYRGGGLYNRAGNVTVDLFTFSGNESTGPNAAGGAVYYSSGGSGASVTFTNSLIADGAATNCFGLAVTDGDNNLADDDSCATIPDTLDLTKFDTSLGINGGRTLTHALLSGSNAIDMAGSCGVATDQRGAGRAGLCDIGAFEFLGCELLEIKSRMIPSAESHSTCNTAVLGPDVILEAPGGSLTIDAGYLATIQDGFWMDPGTELTINIDPSLLPPP